MDAPWCRVSARRRSRGSSTSCTRCRDSLDFWAECLGMGVRPRVKCKKSEAANRGHSDERPILTVLANRNPDVRPLSGRSAFGRIGAISGRSQISSFMSDCYVGRKAVANRGTPVANIEFLRRHQQWSRIRVIPFRPTAERRRCRRCLKTSMKLLTSSKPTPRAIQCHGRTKS